MPQTETPTGGRGWPHALGSNLGPAGASPDRGERATDEQLARAAGRGDVRAFEALYERFEPQLLSFSRHMLGRAHDAEDVVQHTFLAADRALRAGKVPKAVRAWLYTVARNRCVSILRARRDGTLPDAGVPSTENLAAEVEQRDDLRSLLADLRRLPEQQRAALLLAELGDLSHTEVAGVIGVRPDKVKALVFQARETLMAAAHARSIPCRSIQEELAAATGAASRRRHLRHHLDQCAACREYAERVRAQRASLALILPVVPTVAMREGVFAGLACGAAAGAGAGATAGLGLVAAKTTAAKLLTIAAVGGAAAGGATVALTTDAGRDGTRSTERAADRARTAPAPAAVPANTDAPLAPVAAAEQRRPPARADGRGTDDSRPAASRSRRGRKAMRGTAKPSAQTRQRRAHDKTPPGQAKKERRSIPRGQAKQQQQEAPPAIANKAPAATSKAAKPQSAPRSGAAPNAPPPEPPKSAAAPAGSAAPDSPGQSAKEAKPKAAGKGSAAAAPAGP